MNVYQNSEPNTKMKCLYIQSMNVPLTLGGCCGGGGLGKLPVVGAGAVVGSFNGGLNASSNPLDVVDVSDRAKSMLSGVQLDADVGLGTSGAGGGARPAAIGMQLFIISHKTCIQHSKCD